MKYFLFFISSGFKMMFSFFKIFFLEILFGTLNFFLEHFRFIRDLKNINYVA